MWLYNNYFCAVPLIFFCEISCCIQEKLLSLFRYLDGVGVMLSF
ncbi:hypothetical protein HMPREF3218_0201894 [Prevotella bivia]|nr:hypothetical protein HMPREF3218_0201894 [Prevotella bivia]